MYYSIYQRKTIVYLFNKYRFGSKKTVRSDVERFSLKGHVKNYKVIRNNEITLEYEFDKWGNILIEINPTEYYQNEFSSKNLITDRTVYNSADKIIRTETFVYDTSDLLRKKSVEDHLKIDSSYNEFFEYDSRGNSTAAIRQYENGRDDVDTFKYDSKSQMTDHFVFYKSSNNFVGRFNYRRTDFSIEERYFSEVNKLLSLKKSILDLYGNPIQIQKYIKFMSLNSTRNYLYHYDDIGNWISKNITLDGKAEGREIAKIIYYED